jgi:hypothetical protein
MILQRHREHSLCRLSISTDKIFPIIITGGSEGHFRLPESKANGSALLQSPYADYCFFAIHFIYEIYDPLSRKNSDYRIYGTRQTKVLYYIIGRIRGIKNARHISFLISSHPTICASCRWDIHLKGGSIFYK